MKGLAQAEAPSRQIRSSDTPEATQDTRQGRKAEKLLSDLTAAAVRQLQLRLHRRRRFLGGEAELRVSGSECRPKVTGSTGRDVCAGGGQAHRLSEGTAKRS